MENPELKKTPTRDMSKRVAFREDEAHLSMMDKVKEKFIGLT